MSKTRKLTVEPFGEILSERPQGMDFKLYKRAMRLQKSRLRSRLKGFLLRPDEGVGTQVIIKA